MRTSINPPTRKFIILGAAMLMLAVAGQALAQKSGPGRRHFQGHGQEMGPGPRLEMMVRHLDLTEDQAQAIEEIVSQSKAEGVAIRKDLMRLKNKLQGEMLQDEPSGKQVLSLNQDMGELKTQLRGLRLKTRLAVREQLTPDQRDKMLLEGRGQGKRGKARGGNFRGHRFGGPGGKPGGPGNGRFSRGDCPLPDDDK